MALLLKKSSPVNINNLASDIVALKQKDNCSDDYQGGHQVA